MIESKIHLVEDKHLLVLPCDDRTIIIVRFTIVYL